MRELVLVGALMLAGCATQAPSCLPMKHYTGEEQLALAGALAPLDQNGVLVRAIEDYSALRDANRARGCKD